MKQPSGNGTASRHASHDGARVSAEAHSCAASSSPTRSISGTSAQVRITRCEGARNLRTSPISRCRPVSRCAPPACTEGARKATLAPASTQLSPVPPAHGDRLRQVARRVRDSLEAGKSLDYGQEDPGMWRRALIQHFPGLEAALQKAAGNETALESLKGRLLVQAAVDRRRVPASAYHPDSDTRADRHSGLGVHLRLDGGHPPHLG
jgi:hypothetical protein